MSERGQAFTLEGVTAAILLVGGLVFALQATAVTPLSASTSSQHIENQQQASAEGVLATGTDTGSLRVAVLFWDDANEQFHDAAESYYVDQTPDNRFGAALDRAFTSRRIVANVNVYYQEGDRQRQQRMVYRGEPSDNAVSASTTITLTDDDPLYDDTGAPATVTGESHTYDVNAPTNTLNEAPVVRSGVETITDVDGITYERGVDFAVIDDDGDGKPDTIDWTTGGSSPDDTESFTVDYTPAVSGDRFYASDSSTTGVYNVVTVEVVVWRQ